MHYKTEAYCNTLPLTQSLGPECRFIGFEVEGDLLII